MNTPLLPALHRLAGLVLHGLAWSAAWSGLALLIACDNGGYRRTGNGWTYDDQPFNPLDPRSLKPLGPHFARDDRHGYYRGQVVADSHGPSFQVLSAHEARDRQAVYYADTERRAQEYWAWAHVRVRRITGADPVHYQVLAYGYARDGRQAFRQGLPLAVHDAASFEPLSRLVTRDRVRGYHDDREIPGSDGASLAFVDPQEAEHLKDRQHVWHTFIDLQHPSGHPRPVVRLLAGARPGSVRVLGAGYAADGSHAWWRGLPLAGADGQALQRVDLSRPDVDAQDGRHAWHQGRRVPWPAAAPASGPALAASAAGPTSTPPGGATTSSASAHRTR